MLNGQEEPLYERINTFNTTPIKMFLLILVFTGQCLFTGIIINPFKQYERKMNSAS